MFWSFTEFPDKERVELTKERDIAELYVGTKGWEITYKGATSASNKKISTIICAGGASRSIRSCAPG